MITSGRGKYKVWLDHKKIGSDHVFFLGGGEQPHLGGVVICEPGKASQVIRLEGHFDDVVLQPIAEAACRKYHSKVVAAGGIHINHATKKEIELLVKNCRVFVKKI